MDHVTTTEASIADIEKKLRYIAGDIKQKGREILHHYPITPPQFVALQWLLESGDMTIGELSNKMYLACSTTTDLIDRMENNELVKRIRDKKDRRVVRIHLQTKGEAIIHEVIEKRQAYLEQVLRTFSEEQVSLFRQLLNAMHDEMMDPQAEVNTD
ncbi:MarR family winged helix-turn-helix transcriptional regulator [Pontibacillus salicampi]|uniref:MarR family winged helix-turn-helix transcriptional regulator n=1 Tax=Pontibacillus salicampi TaxID=1449801 RepID=A0ABV6LJ38_9BACI